MGFEQVGAEQLQDNVFKLIGRDWMLITAGDGASFNTMTASWGGLGVLWERKVAFCFIRPNRHTYGFMERAGRYTLSFFGEQHRKALTFCGTHSGRDRDKIRESGLTAVKQDGALFFEEARLVLICRKLYYQDISPERFVDPKVHEMYPQKDYHRMYVGEIEQCLVRED